MSEFLQSLRPQHAVRAVSADFLALLLGFRAFFSYYFVQLLLFLITTAFNYYMIVSAYNLHN